MFFDTKQKILYVVAVACFLFAGAATALRHNRKPELPPEISRVVPLDKPTNIELYEDDAGVVPWVYAIAFTWHTWASNVMSIGTFDTPKGGFWEKNHVVIAICAVAVVNVAAGVGGNQMKHFYSLVCFFFVCLLLNMAIDVLLLRQPIHWVANILIALVATIFTSILRGRK